jgi:hypothetical protein
MVLLISAVEYRVFLIVSWVPHRAIVLGIRWYGDRQERSVARKVKQSAA